MCPLRLVTTWRKSLTYRIDEPDLTNRPVVTLKITSISPSAEREGTATHMPLYCRCG